MMKGIHHGQTIFEIQVSVLLIVFVQNTQEQKDQRTCQQDDNNKTVEDGEPLNVQFLVSGDFREACKSIFVWDAGFVPGNRIREFH